MTRNVRYESGTGEVVEIIMGLIRTKPQSTRCPPMMNYAPNQAAASREKQPLGRVASPQFLFTRVRGREILLRWRGAAEGGIMSFVQGKHTEPGFSWEGP